MRNQQRGWGQLRACTRRQLWNQRQARKPAANVQPAVDLETASREKPASVGICWQARGKETFSAVAGELRIHAPGSASSMHNQIRAISAPLNLCHRGLRASGKFMWPADICGTGSALSKAARAACKYRKPLCASNRRGVSSGAGARYRRESSGNRGISSKPGASCEHGTSGVPCG